MARLAVSQAALDHVARAHGRKVPAEEVREKVWLWQMAIEVGLKRIDAHKKQHGALGMNGIETLFEHLTTAGSARRLGHDEPRRRPAPSRGVRRQDHEPGRASGSASWRPCSWSSWSWWCWAGWSTRPSSSPGSTNASTASRSRWRQRGSSCATVHAATCGLRAPSSCPTRSNEGDRHEHIRCCRLSCEWCNPSCPRRQRCSSWLVRGESRSRHLRNHSTQSGALRQPCEAHGGSKS